MVLQFRDFFWRVLPVPFSRRLHRSRPYILGTPGRAQKVLRHVSLRVPIFVGYESTNFLKTVSLCRVCLCEYVLPFEPLHPRRCHFVPCQVGFCQWKPFWIPVEDSFQKAFVEECVFISDVHSEGPSTAEDSIVHNTDHSEFIPVTPRASKHSTSLPWETAKPHDKACCWERIEAPLPPLRPRPKCDFIHPRQLRPFPERLVLQFSNKVILSGYEELDSSGNVFLLHGSN